MSVPVRLYHQIRTQVEFYLSDANLVHDSFLRSQIIDGAIPTRLIAAFPRMQELQAMADSIFGYNSVPRHMHPRLIHDALYESSIKLSPDLVWMLLPPYSHFGPRPVEPQTDPHLIPPARITPVRELLASPPLPPPPELPPARLVLVAPLPPDSECEEQIRLSLALNNNVHVFFSPSYGWTLDFQDVNAANQLLQYVAENTVVVAGYRVKFQVLAQPAMISPVVYQGVAVPLEAGDDNTRTHKSRDNGRKYNNHKKKYNYRAGKHLKRNKVQQDFPALVESPHRKPSSLSFASAVKGAENGGRKADETQNQPEAKPVGDQTGVEA